MKRLLLPEVDTSMDGMDNFRISQEHTRVAWGVKVYSTVRLGRTRGERQRTSENRLVGR